VLVVHGSGPLTLGRTGCAVTHKRERNTLVERLQEFAAEKQIRITILSGDVHLAAVGRFFSAPRLKIPQVVPTGCIAPFVY
jgi:hypothetical protein